MKATIIGLGAMLLLAASTTAAKADHYGALPSYNAFSVQQPTAQRGCHRFFCWQQCVPACQPSYGIQPNQWMPVLPPPGQNGGAPAHPFARSPRDFFMGN
jgi:hypothetical protein